MNRRTLSRILHATGLVASVLGLYQFLKEVVPPDQLLAVIAGIVAFVAIVLWLDRIGAGGGPTDPGRERGKRWFLGAVAAIAALAAWDRIQASPGRQRVAVEELLNGHCWIGYDPSGFDPRGQTAADLDSMARDLRTIRSAGFTGIVTFASLGNLAQVPRLARAANLAVIMGIWSAKDRDEVAAAVQQSHYVNAYVVGHDGIEGAVYTLDQLDTTVRRIRRATGLPVTASEQARVYTSLPRLALLGDWLFPLAHSSLRATPNDPETADLHRDVRFVLDIAEDMARLGQAIGRPVMLKTVTYPWAGASGASADVQARYFAGVRDGLRSPEFGAASIPIVAHSAFDSPWKVGDPFWSWDPFTGLFDAARQPRAAVREVIRRCQHSSLR